MNTPEQHYQADIKAGLILPDAKQQHIIKKLDALHQQLIARHKKRFLLNMLPARKPIRGLYLWGGVGIGKTYLMDVFFQCLPFKRKMRLHFHVFMQQVHYQLRSVQGQKNPLQLVAKQFAKQTDIICFDEFFVTDIADAMLLSGLFQALFARGVCLVATSNQPPDDLYKSGLQRNNFLPAIALIKEHTEVIAFDSKKDYRLRTLQQAGVYFTPLNETSQQAMQHCFDSLAHGSACYGDIQYIAERPIQTIAIAHDVVWYDFKVICNVPRSQHDYLEIAQMYSTVLISNVPKIPVLNETAITYLINLIDVFYDAKVKLILSAATAVDDIYSEGRQLFAFQRTRSRLIEMQSADYLHAEHLNH